MTRQCKNASILNLHDDLVTFILRYLPGREHSNSHVTDVSLLR